MTNFERFRAIYSEKLAGRVAREPNAYAWYYPNGATTFSVELVKRTAARMAIAARNGSITPRDNPAVRDTLKALGVPLRVRDMVAFLSANEEVMP